MISYFSAKKWPHAIALGDTRTALADLYTARELLTEIGDIPHLVSVIENIASIHIALAQWPQAHEHLQVALRHRINLSDAPGEILVRQGIVTVHRAQGQIMEAVQELQIVIHLEKLGQHPELEQDCRLLTELTAMQLQNEATGADRSQP